MSEIEPVSEYELPKTYGDNKAVLMVKDPHWLYVYWDISPVVFDSFCQEFGSELWDKSVPSLKVTNITKNQESFIRINDFSTSWYINVPEPNCIYTAEIGRRVSNRFFVSMAASNHAATPRDYFSSNHSAIFANYREAVAKQAEKSSDIGFTGLYMPADSEMCGISSVETVFGSGNLYSSLEFYSSDFKP